jgi:hypothetical protein
VVAAIEAGGVVLCHCHMGINRGPSLAFAVLLALGWEPVRALDAIRSVRPVAYMGYAEDALRWHLTRAAGSADEIGDALDRLAAWRRGNSLDVVSVIRRTRDQERRGA